MRIRNKCVIGAALIVILSGCSDKDSSMSDKDRAAAQEAVRAMSAAVETTAASLVVINPKHDKQYFIDRQTQGIAECIKATDFASCYKPKFEAMKYE